MELRPRGSRAATLCSSEDVSSHTDGTLGGKTRQKPHIRLLLSFCTSHEMRQMHHKTWFNSCPPHLLRILSALSMSSSKVVFTDRLCGDRFLSATWPVIFRPAGVDQHSCYSHLLYMWLAVLNMCLVDFSCSDTVAAEESFFLRECLWCVWQIIVKGEGDDWDCLPHSLTWPVTQQLVAVVTGAATREINCMILMMLYFKVVEVILKFTSIHKQWHHPPQNIRAVTAFHPQTYEEVISRLLPLCD